MKKLSFIAFISLLTILIGKPMTAESKELIHADFVALQKSLADYSDKLPDLSGIGITPTTAYEEHKHFVYILGRSSKGVIRMIFLRPGVFALEEFTDPKKEPFRKMVDLGEGHQVRKELTRNSEGILVHSHLEISTSDKVFKLDLPADTTQVGFIEISDKDGNTVLAKRQLPSGILPHGKNVQWIEHWDSKYRRDQLAAWDTKKSATELRRVVEEKIVPASRTVIFGCGSGNNAIYLASKGFDVTGMDLAPTGLSIAKKRAKEAGVQVNWVLADVVAPPDLKPFDFVFDRGCYHNVRRYNAKGYVTALKKLTRPGARVLILAGNANEKKHYGSETPPRVKEEDIRSDFADGFKIKWLNEIRFDTRGSEEKRALAWSIFLERKD